MSDKTEQPTPKRLRESREKGDVCKSQDVPSALTVLALSVYIIVMGGHLLESLLAMMELPMKLLSTPYAEAAPRAAEATFHIAVSIVAPLVGLVMPWPSSPTSDRWAYCSPSREPCPSSKT